MKKKVIKFVNRVNRYLNLFIVIPAILGGIWQVLELSVMSPSFVRFFSITQVASDGLLILLIFVVISLSLTYVIWFVTKSSWAKPKKNRVDLSPSSTAAKGVILSAGSLFVLLLGIKPALEEMHRQGFLLGVVVIGFAAATTFLWVFFTGIGWVLVGLIRMQPTLINWIKGYLVGSRGRDEDDELSAIHYLIIVLGLPLLAAIVFGLLIVIGKFRNQYFLPQKLKNLESIDRFVKKHHPDTELTKIVYNNDRYFFVEVNKAGAESEIVIVKFDELFDNSCKED